MNLRILVALMTASVAFAGCTNGDGGVDADSLEEGRLDQIDCGPLVAEHNGMTQAQYDSMPEAEKLPEECLPMFVPAPDPLTNITYSGCTYTGIQNLIPQDAWGPPPSGFSFDYSQADAARLITIISVHVECEELTHRNGSLSDVQWLSSWVVVNEHSDWGSEDYSHNYVIATVIDGEAHGAILDELGLTNHQIGTVSRQANRQTDTEFIGRMGYDVDGFTLDVEVGAGADPVESAGFTNRYYFIDAQGELRVYDAHVGPGIQSLGGAVIQVSEGIIPGTPFALGGIGFYGANGDDGLDIHLTRPDRMVDPSA